MQSETKTKPLQLKGLPIYRGLFLYTLSSKILNGCTYFSLLSRSTALDCFSFATREVYSRFSVHTKSETKTIKSMLTKTKTTSAVDAIALLNECINNIRREMKTHPQVQVSTTLNNGLAESIIIETPTFGLNLQLK